MPDVMRFVLRSIRRVFGTQQIIDNLDAVRELQAEVNRLNCAIAIKMNAVAVQTVLCSSPESWFECEFNGVRMWLPRHTLRMMVKGLYGREDGPFEIEAERAHTLWLMSHSRPGATFVDIGAATGTMTLPIALKLPGVRVIAFEPSRTANRVLRETLVRNQVQSVEVHDTAVSDVCGQASFNEMGFDPTGAYHYMPEVSALAHSDTRHALQIAKYDVPVTTLDTFFASRHDAHTVRTMKIDVEGFETRVLRGGADFLARTRPYLAIDIHDDPFGTGTTEPGVRACLEPLGYRFEKMKHVLACYPPDAS